MRKSKALKILAVTTGDQDGVGPEVTYKALGELGPQTGVAFVVFRSAQVSPAILKSADKSWERLQVDSLEVALSSQFTPDRLIEIVSPDLPPLWVETCARAALQKKTAGLVTAPLSKTLIRKAGLREVGHTEILARLSRSKSLTMSFWGPQFSVALGSTHIPVRSIPSKVTVETVVHHLRQVVREFPHRTRGAFRVGVVGLNPHAGESGLIGSEETRIFAPALKKLRREFPKVVFSDPLVPDAAFLPQNQKNYDVFFCMYHDQGLIPFKMAHGQSRGCQISLGLPFVRTSVDHGTAKDLFGKNKAEHGSMIDALSTAIALFSR